MAAIGYPVTISDTGEVDYTGDEYQVFDEGTQFADDLWCRECSWNGTLAQLDAEPSSGRLEPDDEAAASPRGRCDACGAPCDPNTGDCTADKEHEVANRG